MGMAGWGCRGYSVVSKMCGGLGSSGELRACFIFRGGGGGGAWLVGVDGWSGGGGIQGAWLIRLVRLV